MLEALTLQSFAPHVGSDFFLPEAEGVSLTLVEAKAATAHMGDGRRPPLPREPFTLLFRGPARPILPQRIHRLEHPVLGTLEIFIVPVGPNLGGIGYEAVFS
jgi:hypothetical protein